MPPSNDHNGNEDGAGDAVALRLKDAVNNAADQLLCPITLELPVDPVMAADKIIYEREAIRKVIERAERNGDELRSPSTNEPMGAELLQAVQVRNTIEHLVKTGALDGDKAQKWEEHMADESYISSLKEKAEGGDADSMFRLGRHYYEGERGLEGDDAKAYEWYKKASDKNYPPAMAQVGEDLVYGVGVEETKAEGMLLLGMAAMHDGGSACAAFALGTWYSKGDHGLPKDKDRAMFFLRMAVDGSCEYKDDLDSYDMNSAKKLLEELTNDDN